MAAYIGIFDIHYRTSLYSIREAQRPQAPHKYIIRESKRSCASKKVRIWKSSSSQERCCHDSSKDSAEAPIFSPAPIVSASCGAATPWQPFPSRSVRPYIPQSKSPCRLKRQRPNRPMLRCRRPPPLRAAFPRATPSLHMRRTSAP